MPCLYVSFLHIKLHLALTPSILGNKYKEFESSPFIFLFIYLHLTSELLIASNGLKNLETQTTRWNLDMFSGLKLRWRKMEREINIEDSNWLMRLDIWSIHQHFQSKLFYFLIYHVSLTLGTCCVICCTCCVIFFTYFRRYIKYSHPCHHCLQKWHIYKI